MAMPSLDEMKAKVAEVVRQRMPSAKVERVDAKPFVDSEGEKSLSITVVVHDRPPSDEAARLVEAVDEFRTWLVGRDDDRFPYFRLLSEADERELQQTHS